MNVQERTQKHTCPIVTQYSLWWPQLLFNTWKTRMQSDIQALKGYISRDIENV